MNFKSLVLTAVLATAILGFSYTSAQTTDTAKLIAQLQAQIAQLTAQIKTLLGQKNAIVSHTDNGTPFIDNWCHTFSKFLSLGSNGDEALALHTALSYDLLGAHDQDVWPNFDANTKNDVIKFQAKYGITQTGTVGPKTRARLNSLYGCGQTANTCTTGDTKQCANGNGTQACVNGHWGACTTTPSAQGLTSDMILNSNGFTNGQKSLPNGQVGGEGLSNIVIGNDKDGSQEAAAIDTWCSVSCGETLYAFKLVNNSVAMVKLPGSGVVGASQNISSIQINNGTISDTETDFGNGTRTNYYTVALVNGVLQGTMINSSTVSCTPNWTCQWSACAFGYQGQVPVDSNNCNSLAGQPICSILTQACGSGQLIITSAESPGNPENQFNPGSTVTLYGGFPSSSTTVELDRVGTVEHYFASATKDEASGHLIFVAPNLQSGTYSLYLISSPNGGSKISNAIQVTVLSKTS